MGKELKGVGSAAQEQSDIFYERGKYGEIVFLSVLYLRE